MQDAPHPSRLQQTVDLPTSSTVGMSLLEGQQAWQSKQPESQSFLANTTGYLLGGGTIAYGNPNLTYDMTG